MCEAKMRVVMVVGVRATRARRRTGEGGGVGTFGVGGIVGDLHGGGKMSSAQSFRLGIRVSARVTHIEGG